MSALTFVVHKGECRHSWHLQYWNLFIYCPNYPLVIPVQLLRTFASCTYYRTSPPRMFNYSIIRCAFTFHWNFHTLVLFKKGFLKQGSIFNDTAIVLWEPSSSSFIVPFLYYTPCLCELFCLMFCELPNMQSGGCFWKKLICELDHCHCALMRRRQPETCNPISHDHKFHHIEHL